MLKYVHQPELIKLIYPANSLDPVASLALNSLGTLYGGLDVYQDPWIIEMGSDPSTRESRAYQKAITSHKT